MGPACPCRIPIQAALATARRGFALHQPLTSPQRRSKHESTGTSRACGSGARMERRIIADLATRRKAPHWVKVAGTSGAGPAREGLRAYVGTIPDYTGGGRPGVKLSGVRPGSPADKAGLKAGDVIVGLAHKRIANIYDYTYALEAVKIGTPVEIVIERGGKQITQTVVPTQRK